MILDETCAGKSGEELIDCVAEKMLGGCVGAAIFRGIRTRSPEQAVEGVIDCWKCDAVGSIRDTGQILSCMCCLGQVVGARVKDIIVIIPELSREPAPRPL